MTGVPGSACWRTAPAAVPDLIPDMLYYSPQIWCSDDTDAIERLKIQEGTALIYPLSTMGAHVSDCPNHTVGRVTPFADKRKCGAGGNLWL